MPTETIFFYKCLIVISINLNFSVQGSKISEPIFSIWALRHYFGIHRAKPQLWSSFSCFWGHFMGSGKNVRNAPNIVQFFMRSFGNSLHYDLIKAKYSTNDRIINFYILVVKAIHINWYQLKATSSMCVHIPTRVLRTRWIRNVPPPPPTPTPTGGNNNKRNSNGRCACAATMFVCFYYNEGNNAGRHLHVNR